MLDRLQRVQNYFKMSLKEGFKRKITIMKMQEFFFFSRISVYFKQVSTKKVSKNVQILLFVMVNGLNYS